MRSAGEGLSLAHLLRRERRHVPNIVGHHPQKGQRNVVRLEVAAHGLRGRGHWVVMRKKKKKERTNTLALPHMA
jgi:ribosomal protein L28